MEVIATTRYIKNGGPVTRLKKTPDNLRTRTTPSVKHLKAHIAGLLFAREIQKEGGYGVRKWERVIVVNPTQNVASIVWDTYQGDKSLMWGYQM